MSGELDAGSVVVKIIAANELKNPIKDAAKDLKDFGESAGDAGKKTGEAEEKTGSFVTKLGMLAVVTVAVAAAIKGFGIALGEARENAQADAFERMGGSIERLRTATKGMVDDDSLVAIGASAKSLGLSADQMDGLAAVSVKLSRVMGTDVKEAFDSISRGAALGNEKMLKRAGIMVDMKDAEEKFAKAAGKSASQLSEHGKQLAHVNAVTAAAQSLTASLGDSIGEDAARMEKFQASILNVASLLEEKLIPVFSWLAEGLTAFVDGLVEFFSGSWTDVMVKGVLLTAGIVLEVADALGLDVKAKLDEIHNAYNEMTDLSTGAGGPPKPAPVTPLTGKPESAFTNVVTPEMKAAADAAKALRDALIAARDQVAVGGTRDRMRDFAQIGADLRTAMRAAASDVKTDKSGFGIGSMDQIGLASAERQKSALGFWDSWSSKLKAGEVVWNDFNEALDLAGLNLDDLSKTAQEAAKEGVKLANTPMTPEELAKLNPLDSGEITVISQPDPDIANAIRAGFTGLMSGSLAGIGGGVGAISKEFGNEAGQMLGAAMADPLTNALIGIVSSAFNAVIDGVANAMKSLFSDSRLSSALGAAADAVAKAGAAILGLGLVAATLGAPLALLVMLTGPFGVAIIALMGVALLLEGAFVALFTAVAGAPFVVLGVFAAFTALATQTKSYERMQGALSVVLDRVVKALEPFFASALGMVGAFSAIADVFLAFVSQWTSMDVMWKGMFEVVKWTGLVIGALGLVSAAVYDGFVMLGGVIYATAAVMQGKDWGKSYDEFTKSFGVDLGKLNNALKKLAGTTYEEAVASGEAAAKQWDLAQATDKLSSSVLNAPSGFMVESYRNAAQMPTQNASPGGSTPPLAGGGMQLVVEGDLNIEAANTPAEDLLETIMLETERRSSQATGNPMHTRKIR